MSGVMDEYEEMCIKGYSASHWDMQVCATHFENQYIKNYIHKADVYGECDYCGKTGNVICLGDLEEFLGDKITQYYCLVDSCNLSLISNDLDYKTEKSPCHLGGYIGPAGWSLYDLDELFDEVELFIEDKKLKNDIKGCFLDEGNWTRNNPFEPTRKDILSKLWQSFEIEVYKKQVEFNFNAVLPIEINNKYGAVWGFNLWEELAKTVEEQKLIKRLGTETKIYRCRDFNSGEYNPSFDELTAPPSEHANNNRMSAKGISMFYGAFKTDVAKIEASAKRDGNFNSSYAVGCFKPKRRLHVLDLANVPIIDFWMPGDYLSGGFLHDFSEIISRKANTNETNDTTNNEYLPTQKLTEYFSSIFKTTGGLLLDGLTFKSAYVEGEVNVVLFCNHEESFKTLNLDRIVEKENHE